MSRLFGRTGVGLWAILVMGGVACTEKAHTAAKAYERFSSAVKARDGKALWEALDLETRWSWMSIQRTEREAYDIVLSNFPEGADRDRHLRRFENAATTDNAQQLFAKERVNDALWSDLASALTDRPSFTNSQGRAETMGRNGKPLLFRLGPGQKEGWGYAGFAEESENLKKRAVTDLEVIRLSATDYERAAARQGL